MAYWGTPKSDQMYSSKGLDETDFVMGVMLSQKPGNDLIQNCDLPPPTKVFSGLSDNGAVLSSPLNRKKLHSLVGDHEDDVGLLKALRLSQTRAREAEAKCAAIIKDRDALALAFMHDSMQIFAYRQFVRLLECQVSQFQKQNCCNCGNTNKGEETEEEEIDDRNENENNNNNNNNGFTFFMTLAFCLGVAGVGLAIGCTFLYSN